MYRRSLFTGQPPNWRLSVVAGPLKGKTFRLGARNILGRATECEIRVPSEGVSRQHAAIVANDDDEPYLMDLASKNGTFVDGKPILRIRLEHGMSFRMSSSEFVFSIDDDSEKPD